MQFKLLTLSMAAAMMVALTSAAPSPQSDSTLGAVSDSIGQAAQGGSYQTVGDGQNGGNRNVGRPGGRSYKRSPQPGYSLDGAAKKIHGQLDRRVNYGKYTDEDGNEYDIEIDAEEEDGTKEDEQEIEIDIGVDIGIPDEP